MIETFGYAFTGSPVTIVLSVVLVLVSVVVLVLAVLGVVDCVRDRDWSPAVSIGVLSLVAPFSWFAVFGFGTMEAAMQEQQVARAAFEEACPEYECTLAELEAVRLRLELPATSFVYREWLEAAADREVLRGAGAQ